MKSTRKKRIRAVGLVWVGSIVAALAVYMAVLSPQGKSLTRLEQTLEKKRQAYDEAVEATSPDSRQKLQERLDSLKGQLALFAVEQEKSANLTFDISTMARDNSLGAFNVGSNPDRRDSMADAPSLEQGYISVDFEGSFVQFARFLNALERNRPVLFIDSFTLESSKNSSSSNKISMELAALVRKVEKDS